MGALRLGIDLGGSKTEGVVLAADGFEIARRRVPTVKGSYAATLATVNSLVLEMEKLAGQRFGRFGIGIPGSISPRTGLVRNANSTWINNRPLGVDLERKTGRVVRISNDANCLALSEMHDGAAQGAHAVFAVILGTGVGGGLVLNGQIINGAHGLAGEWGHIPLAHEDLNAPPCFCGRRGCLEQYLSGPAIVRDYLASGGDGAENVEEISARAQAGEDLAKSVLARHLARLGQGLGTIVNVLDPEVLVLGGGVSNLPGLIKALPGAIAPHVFAAKGDMIEIKVRRAKWGDSSGVRGAARLWRLEE
ncbi:MAG: ROK family protein [Alphaproteobacteria bacterium]|nr:ROK family protein [Alphaproteobacteria bacterium]